MTDSHKKPAPQRASIDLQLAVEEVAVLQSISNQAVRAGCSESRYLGAHKDASGAWRIPLSSLPPWAQVIYYAQHVSIAPGGWAPEERRELPHEEAEVLWRRFEDATASLKTKAQRDAEACHLWQHLKANSIPLVQALAEVKARYGIGKSAIYEKISRIKGYDPLHWPALLLGQWTGDNAKRAEWNDEAWRFFLSNALVPNCRIKTAWKRTEREARLRGWGEVPSYDTARRDFEALPHDVVTLIKEGETALKVKAPTARRDYTSLALHEVWSLDGRRMDLMVRDDKGKYSQEGKPFRLWILAIQDVRSRMLIGYALGGALNADLVRAAFLDAIKTTSNLIPRNIQLDNGMENAAKEITGGALWRRRGKVMDNEIIGLFPLLDINVQWTTVAHGQAKPIERLFGTLAGMVETRPEFRGAYCGNSPEARPEEWDRSKAAPVELVEQALREEIHAYHRTPHRGQGMCGKSPLQVYTEEINRLGLAVRRITEAQARLCAHSATPITIRKDGSFTILGAAYRSDATARLVPGRGYYARYNPHDLSAPVYVYRREKLLCEAERIELTPFITKEGGKASAKRTAAYTKAVKAQEKALRALAGADTKEYLAQLASQVLPEKIDPETGEVLPVAQVLEMVKSQAEMPKESSGSMSREDEELRKEAKRLQEREAAAAAERLRKRALAGR
ncbi:MAG: hypothetical protein C3F19_07245 [Rhodocyclales bacterium]|nr:MAG: hypothetical protein C3F19_07245 [Rhodocyclales bacterium]